jgi:hypothetical protein
MTELNLKIKVAETPCWDLVNKKEIFGLEKVSELLMMTQPYTSICSFI